MTYTTAQKNEAASLLCSYFPNLHYGVARTWVTIEAGEDNNVFGVTIAGRLQKYRTMEQGVAAAALRIKTLAVYRPLLAALSSPHPDSHGCPGFGPHANAQATAFAKSPWHSGVSGLRRWSGIDAYYARIFRSHGYTIK